MSTMTEQPTLGLKTAAPTPSAPKITISEKAAEEVKRIIAETQTGEPKLYLRLRVVGGGCSGFQHKLDLDPQVNPKIDEVFELNGVEVVVDKKSLLFLNGTVLDYDTNLISKGFVFNNPNAKQTCGCGSSFGA